MSWCTERSVTLRPIATRLAICSRSLPGRGIAARSAYARVAIVPTVRMSEIRSRLDVGVGSSRTFALARAQMLLAALAQLDFVGAAAVAPPASASTAVTQAARK